MFRGVPQDYSWFLAHPYWVQKYGVRLEGAATVIVPVAIEEADVLEADDEPTYTIRWYNDLFEICDPMTLSRKIDAQPQPRPKGI